MGIFQVAIFWWEFSGGKFSRGKFEGWKFYGWEFSGYPLKELKVIFVSATKIGESTIIILQLTFFQKNLQFFKSNQVSTYRKLNLPFTTCRNAKKSRTDQSIPIVSLLCLKRDDPQTFKSGGCKNIFSSVWAIGTTCFD